MTKQKPEQQNSQSKSMEQEAEETFWQGVLKFRERIEREGIEFTDEDFADLRDRSPGREIEL